MGAKPGHIESWEYTSHKCMEWQIADIEVAESNPGVWDHSTVDWKDHSTVEEEQIFSFAEVLMMIPRRKDYSLCVC